MRQKEISQDRKPSELAVSQLLEPKLDVLLSKKVKVHALKTKPHKKEQHYKIKHTTREQKAKEPQIRDHSVDSESTLAKFAKRPIGVELSFDYSSDEFEETNDNKKPSGKGSEKSSGKDSVSKKESAKEKGRTAKREKKSFGRPLSFPQQQQQQKHKKSFPHGTSQKRGYLGRNFIPGFSWKNQQQQQKQQTGKPWQKTKSWRKKDDEEER